MKRTKKIDSISNIQETFLVAEVHKAAIYFHKLLGMTSFHPHKYIAAHTAQVFHYIKNSLVMNSNETTSMQGHMELILNVRDEDENNNRFDDLIHVK